MRICIRTNIGIDIGRGIGIGIDIGIGIGIGIGRCCYIKVDSATSASQNSVCT
jgi:hypothetical protein